MVKEGAATVTYQPKLTGLFLAILAALVASGCATTERQDYSDPFEPLNRQTHKFNEAVDKAVLIPVSKGYKTVTPDPVEQGVGNFFDNLTYPTVFTNQLLQGKFADAFDGFFRFGVNSTFGVAGIFDVASPVMGLEKQNEDFGQTMARWGVPSGPYIVVPVRGGVTLRDGVGGAMAIPLEPTTYFNEPDLELGLRTLSVIDTSAGLLEAREMVSRDSYLFLRDAYFQRREFQINDGAVLEDDPFLDD